MRNTEERKVICLTKPGSMTRNEDKFKSYNQTNCEVEYVIKDGEKYPVLKSKEFNPEKYTVNLAKEDKSKPLMLTNTKDTGGIRVKLRDVYLPLLTLIILMVIAQIVPFEDLSTFFTFFGLDNALVELSDKDITILEWFFEVFSIVYGTLLTLTALKTMIELAKVTPLGNLLRNIEDTFNVKF